MDWRVRWVCGRKRVRGREVGERDDASGGKERRERSTELPDVKEAPVL